ncbi:RNA polymerase sigma-54 factor [Paenibacillus marchantiophytorum]|uniref:RNA polymerase sigma-54 factor n=1 Tax=Paenibacillus marchantiophytorum TaxID=1619310 RepID=A0ABQ1ETR6_9BACL|nr:RNA polymerase factor sigma-54 [Paenibacillus marchantiophytorum]GFZ86883.1 RNA polymerase sigma-54 factor [Paenibacillus marchantiophytorum]
MEILLTAEQEQKLLLTPQMRQSMEILHMSSLDLNEFIKQKSMDNPFIELQPVKDIPAMRHASSSEQDWWFNVDLSSEATLESVLLEQLTYMKLDRAVLALCKWIIGNLDDKGYLLHSIEEISAFKGASSSQVREAVGVVQGFEPYGVGASTLAECLILQLRQELEGDPLVCNLVQHDLLSIAEGRFRQLAEKYETDLAEIKAALQKISSLNPKPGALYSRGKTPYIIADLQLKQVEGKYEVFLESGFLPAITLSGSYFNLMEQIASRDVHLYLKRNWQAAKGLIDSIERRKVTLLKVAGVIFQLQAGFCEKGSSFIQPMSMKQVAEALRVHESTISRTVSHKYIRTPWGLFELKHFFSSSIKQADGTTVSAIYIKERIREWISSEKPASPLSDQQIASLLTSDGLLISRRTVTKYREQMNLQPSMRRRRREPFNA